MGCWLAGFLFLAVAPALAQQAVPPLTGRVVDQADILSSSTESTLTDLLAAHEAATSNQVAVLTVPSLGGETIETFSLRVAQTWALGTAENDNGVLLLVARDDRELRIEVGYGLEGALPDAVAGRIIRGEIVPHFRNGDYDTGVLVGAQRIVGALEGTYTPPAEANPDKPPFIFGLMFLLIPLIFVFQAIFMSGFFRWFLFLFLIPFFGVSGFAFTGTLRGTLLFLAGYAVVFIGLSSLPKVREIREKVATAQKSGKTVKVGPFTMGGSSSGGGWSSGGSSFGGGSSFSGGGGSFGGGGSSGSW